MPCKHVVAALWNRTGNKSDVDIPESWVTASYWLVTWKKVYSYKTNPLNGKHLSKKHPCPNTLIPPKFHPQIGRPPKKRKTSADELSSQKMISGGKLSRAGKTVTCDTSSQASVVRGSQDATTPRTAQRPAATPRTSQRSAATLRLSQRSATTTSAKATARGKEKVV
ncbi:hypothetical protein Tco_0683755 [Tanacetum coccineum]